MAAEQESQMSAMQLQNSISPRIERKHHTHHMCILADTSDLIIEGSPGLLSFISSGINGRTLQLQTGQKDMRYKCHSSLREHWLCGARRPRIVVET